MSSVVISGDTSGAITLSAPAVAGTNTITLPASTGTVLTTGSPQSGGVIQVVQASSSNGSTTNSDFSGGNLTSSQGVQVVTASITPKFSTSKILATYSCGCGTATNASYALGLFRGTTLLSQEVLWYSNSGGGRAFIVLSAYDSPSTTSSTTYSVRVAGNGGNAFYYGTYDNGISPSTTYTTQPGLVLMEIAA